MLACSASEILGQNYRHAPLCLAFFLHFIPASLQTLIKDLFYSAAQQARAGGGGVMQIHPFCTQKHPNRVYKGYSYEVTKETRAANCQLCFPVDKMPLCGKMSLQLQLESSGCIRNRGIRTFSQWLYVHIHKYPDKQGREKTKPEHAQKSGTK